MIRIVVLVFLTLSPFVGSHATAIKEPYIAPNCDVIGATYDGDTAAVRRMIEANCDLDIRDSYEMTALFVAAMMGHPTIAWLLIEAGANLEYGLIFTPLQIAAGNDQTEIVRLLIRAGVGVDEVQNGVPETALHIAATGNYIDTINLLIDEQAAIEAKGPLNRTPLHSAARYGSSEAAKALVKAGANINALDDEGKTPLHLTVKDIIPYVLIEGFEIRDSSPSTWSESQKKKVLEERKNLIDTARVLVELGAKLNIKDKITVTENNVTTSDDDVKTANIWTPLHYAALRNNTDVIRILADAGALLNQKDTNGNTPLHIASKQGNAEAIGVLFEVGADDRVKNAAKLRANEVAKNDAIKTMVENPGSHWPLKAYAVGNVSSQSVNTAMRITCDDGKICRIFLDCFDEDGDRFQGWIGDLERMRGKTTIGSIDKKATLSLSLSELKTLVDTTQEGGLDCALHSQRRITAQVRSTTNSGVIDTTAYRLSEKHNVSEKSFIRFYYGDSSTPYIHFRCLADEGEECTNTGFQCVDDEATARSTINAGTVERLHLYTVAGSDSANTDNDADYRIPKTTKGWYSCTVHSTKPFMVYVTDFIRKGSARFVANSTAISME